MRKYIVDGDPHSELDIARYVEGQTRDETVEHVELIKQVVVVGDSFNMWDVTTDKGRWWVVTNLTNLYSQKHFPSLDYTLTFHIGLMMRLKSKPDHVSSENRSPFDELIRQVDQAEDRHHQAQEVEEFQSVGMLLRECLITLLEKVRIRIEFPIEIEAPQNSNFVDWSEIFLNQLCSGKQNKDLRKHVKNMAKETWQLVNWLTHSRSADQTASSIAVHSTQTVIGHIIQLLERGHQDSAGQCPLCGSKIIRSHYDIDIPPEGDYYLSCGVCQWTNYPMTKGTPD